MKILYVSQAMPFSGAEIVLLNLLKNNDLWESVVYVPPGAFYEELKNYGIQVVPAHYIGILQRRKSIFWPFRFIYQLIGTSFELYRVIKRLDPDWIHSNVLSTTPYCIIPSLLSRKRLVWHMHDIKRFPSLDCFAMAFFSLFSKYVIAISFAVRHALMQCHIPSEKIKLCYNGIDQASIRDHEPMAQPLFTKRAGTLNFAQIGLLEPRKGSHILLEALNLLNREGALTKDVHFYFVGNTFNRADYVEQLKEMIRAYGLSDRVTFCGKTRNMRSVYENIDVLIHTPTEPEPFGMVVIEAMLMGCLVLAADDGAIPELIEDHRTGLLFKANDIDHLACEIRALVNNRERFEHIKRAAAECVKSKFSLGRQRERLMDLYQSRETDGYRAEG